MMIVSMIHRDTIGRVGSRFGIADAIGGRCRLPSGTIRCRLALSGTDAMTLVDEYRLIFLSMYAGDIIASLAHSSAAYIAI